MAQRFEFDFDPKFMPMLLAWGATPRSSRVTITDDGLLDAKFGWTSISTPLSNISSFELSGDYHWYKAIGVRMSLTDQGLTFGSNARSGVCLKFEEPITTTPRLGKVRHPGLTLTLKDRDAFVHALEAARTAPPGGSAG
jgi:hypothetical protein